MRNFVAIDFETATGFRDSICQIGVAEVVDSVVKETKSWLVQPPLNLYWGSNIEIHGITPEMTENSPNFSEVWAEVKPFLEGKIVVAHNTSFDMYCLRDALHVYEIEYPSFEYICSCKTAKKIFPELDNHKLATVSEVLGIQLEKHHDACADAVACAHIMLKCLDKMGCNINEIADCCGFNVGKFQRGSFSPCIQKRFTKKSLSEIQATPGLLDENSHFYQKTVCFTGTIEYGTHKSLMQMIKNIGGEPVDSVTAKTDILVVGQQDYRVVGEDGMSNKQRKAVCMRETGAKIEIMSEYEFLEHL